LLAAEEKGEALLEPRRLGALENGVSVSEKDFA